MIASSPVRRGVAVLVLVLVLGVGIGAGAALLGGSPFVSVGAAPGPPPGTPANPDPPHVRLKGTSTVSPGWSQPFWVAIAPPCPVGYHAAGGTVGTILPFDVAIGADAFIRDEQTGIETQAFWLNTISGNAFAEGAVVTVYAECVKGTMPA